MKGNIINKVLVKFADIDKEDITRIRVVFPFNTITLQEIKQIKGRTWIKRRKAWFISFSLENCFKLRDLGFKLSIELKEKANKVYKQSKIKVMDIPGLNGTLLPYQNDGVSFVEQNNGRALIADEMGLGKTVQALAWLQLHQEARPAIIICPASLKLNWGNEANKWLSECNTQVIFGNKKVSLTGDIIIINYHIIPNKYKQINETDVKEIKFSGWIDWLLQYNAKCLIVDESHIIKNNIARWTAPILKLGRLTKYCIALSGTLIEKEVADAYNTIKLIDPDVFANRTAFLQRYTYVNNNSFSKKYNGVKNEKELFKLLSQKIMIRRKKADVLKELPDKIYSYIPVKLDNLKEYNSAVKDFADYVKNKTEIEVRVLLAQIIKDDISSPIEINDHKLRRLQKENAGKVTPLTKLNELKQLAIKGKIKAVINWISDFLESGEKLIVFCEHLAPMDEIETKFKKISVRIDGGVSAKNRQKAVDDFQQNKKVKLFIGNSAAQVGLTLTAASNVAIIEYPWNPGPLTQRIDRAHRIGQKFPVNVYFMCAVGTIEKSIAEGLLRKQEIADKVLDGGLTETSSLFEDIINLFKK